MEFYNLTSTLNTDGMQSHEILHLLSTCMEISYSDVNETLLFSSPEPMPGLFKKRWTANFYLLFDVILVGCILLAGMTGNILSCLVLSRDRSHGTTSLILTSLAICDTLFLVDCLFFQFLKTLSFYIIWLYYINVYAHISKLLYASGMAFRMMRNWTVVLVSLERWVAVCRPLHAPSICTRRKAHIAISLIVSLSFVYNIPHFFIVGAVPLWCFDNQSMLMDNFSMDRISSNNLPLGILVYHSAIRPWVNSNYAFKLVYRLISYTILVVILPNVIIAVFNVLLIRGIKYANARRAQIVARLDRANRQIEQCSYQSLRRECSTTSKCCHSSAAASENHAYFVRIEKSNRSRTMEVNRLCVGVIVIYLVCELPAVGYQVIYLLNHKGLIEVTRPVTNALVCLNSGINFFIYVFLGRRFRSQLKEMFRNLGIRCGLVKDHRKVNLNMTHYVNANHPAMNHTNNNNNNNKDADQFGSKNSPLIKDMRPVDISPTHENPSMSCAYTTSTSVVEI